MGSESNLKKRPKASPKLRASHIRLALIVCIAGIVALSAGLGIVSWKAADTEAKLEQYKKETEALLADSEEKARKNEDKIARLDDELEEAAAMQDEGEMARRIAEIEEQLKAARSENEEIKRQRDEYYNILNASKLVSLTFDDGPGKYTDQLLDELKARNIKATFFVLGIQAVKFPDTIRRMVDEGHEIACHTWDHKNLTKLTPEEIAEEMQKTIDAVHEITDGRGVMRLMRPPGGNYNDDVQEDSRNRDWRIVKWSVDTLDWQNREVNAILDAAYNSSYKIGDNAIVLMHDIYQATVEAAVIMMDRLIEEEYAIVTATQMLDMRMGGGVAGEVYKSGII